MESDKKLEAMEQEVKLLKGELKNSLASVRDYLLNMELPSAEFATILAALGDGGDQKVTMKGSFTAPPSGEPPPEEVAATGQEDSLGEPYDEEYEEPYEEGSEMPTAEEDDLAEAESPLGDDSEMMSEDGLTGPDGTPISEEAMEPEGEFEPDDEILAGDELGEGEDDESGAFDEFEEPFESDEGDESITPEAELPEEEEQLMEYDKTGAGVGPSVPKVNMLANLINWISRAKKEIGDEQLPVFLEVYGISGHLSPELKETIIHLAEIAAEKPEVTNNADVWSQSMLSLHGILTGGDAPRYPIIPSWSDVTSEAEDNEEEIIEVDKQKEQPVKLKLVFPNGDGKSKEFCIDLNPAADSNGSTDNLVE